MPKKRRKKAVTLLPGLGSLYDHSWTAGRGLHGGPNLAPARALPQHSPNLTSLTDWRVPGCTEAPTWHRPGPDHTTVLHTRHSLGMAGPASRTTAGRSDHNTSRNPYHITDSV